MARRLNLIAVRRNRPSPCLVRRMVDAHFDPISFFLEFAGRLVEDFYEASVQTAICQATTVRCLLT